MYSTVGATISSKFPVFCPSLNQAAVSSGRFSTSMPILRHSWIANTAKSWRSEEHTSELQSRSDLVCRLLLEKKNEQLLNLVSSATNGRSICNDLVAHFFDVVLP